MFDFIGCSIHYINEKLDRGSILARKRLKLFPGMRIWKIRAFKTRLHVDMIVEILKNWSQAKNNIIPNEVEKGIYRSWAPWWVYFIADYYLRKFIK
ncbi:MAG: hypothetical protein ACTSVV_18385 [Promethearchaeota archaeon]